MEHPNHIPLSQLQELDQGRVQEVHVAEEFVERVQGMGFFPGELVQVMKKAPLGDPVIYRLGGTTVSLRREISSQIVMEIMPPFSVNFAQTGQRVIIKNLIGGRGFLKKMEGLGIRQKGIFEIERNHGLQVELKGKDGRRIRVGQGMVHRIKVSPLTSGEN